MSRILASSLRDMRVLTDKGLRVGNVYDVEVDEGTGDVDTLVIKPESEEVAESLQTDDEGFVLVPVSAVASVKDYIVINESSLTIQLQKTTR